MEALYFGSANGGENHGGAGAGPWIMADMENALWVRHQLWQLCFHVDRLANGWARVLELLTR